MAKPAQLLETKRRKPHQARAEETVAAILEAGAQILESGSLPAFTTNAIAARAGVSIGTLYQYFADKNALLRTLAEREMQRLLADVAKALRGEIDPSPDGRIRAMVRALINGFGGRQRARKAVLQTLFAQGASVEMMAPVAAFIAEMGVRAGQREGSPFPALSREQLFVLSRALMGPIRAAVLEEQPFFKGRAFEDELVRLLLAYLQALK